MITNIHQHDTVLLKEAVHNLDVKPYCTYVDTTIGQGGHASYILELLKDTGTLIGIDRDDAAISYLQQRWQHKKNVFLYNSCFSYIDQLVNKPVAGILVDLGTCMSQIKDGGRGMSFLLNGPLDMRMDRKSHKTALHIIRTYSQKQLARIFSLYANEKRALFLARIIKEHCFSIKTTLDLANLISRSATSNRSKTSIHPATRVFQALRIEVNDEVNELMKFLPRAYNLLGRHGKLVVISFHSVEDRIVKKFMQAAVSQQYNEVFDGRYIFGKAGWVTKFCRPSHTEKFNNVSCRSAVMRSICKL